MQRIDNAGALRAWLRGCPAIDPARPFGVDHLTPGAGGYALCAAAGELKMRENILGRVEPLSKQTQDYLFAVRGDNGADAAGGLESLALLQAVAAWIRAQNAAGNLPARGDGRVTAALPVAYGAAVDFGADTARYQMRIRVFYETD